MTCITPAERPTRYPPPCSAQHPDHRRSRANHDATSTPAPQHRRFGATEKTFGVETEMVAAANSCCSRRRALCAYRRPRTWDRATWDRYLAAVPART